MAGDVVCDCWACWCGAPGKFKLSVSGIQPVQDDPCPDCADLDGDYILEHNAVDALTFHSRGGPSAMGYGVHNVFAAQVLSTTNACHALLIRCDGSRYCFSCQNPADSNA